MEQKNYLILDKEFIDYCKINNIEDVEKFAKETFKKGFNLLKYGEGPKGFLKPKDKISVEYESTNIPPEKPVKLVSIGKENSLYDE